MSGRAARRLIRRVLHYRLRRMATPGVALSVIIPPALLRWEHAETLALIEDDLRAGGPGTEDGDLGDFGGSVVPRQPRPGPTGWGGPSLSGAKSSPRHQRALWITDSCDEGGGYADPASASSRSPWLPAVVTAAVVDIGLTLVGGYRGRLKRTIDAFKAVKAAVRRLIGSTYQPPPRDGAGRLRPVRSPRRALSGHQRRHPDQTSADPRAWHVSARAGSSGWDDGGGYADPASASLRSPWLPAVVTAAVVDIALTSVGGYRGLFKRTIDACKDLAIAKSNWHIRADYSALICGILELPSRIFPIALANESTTVSDHGRNSRLSIVRTESTNSKGVDYDDAQEAA